jgi:hypothetical protein
MRVKTVLLVVMLLPSVLVAQEPPASAVAYRQAIAEADRQAAESVVAEARSDFHRALIVAARNRVKAGEMSRRDLMRLRIAMLSPAFAEHAEDLAVIQMSASGSDDVPLDASGQVDRARIDWEAIAAFLERLVPLIIQLIGIFGGGV